MILAALLWLAAIAVALFSALFVATTWNGATLLGVVLFVLGLVAAGRAQRKEGE